MSIRPAKLGLSLVLCAAGFFAAILLTYTTGAATLAPGDFRSKVVRWEDAPSHTADWGEMRRYFTGESFGTRKVLVATAVVKPGKSVHRAHRHAEEEYLVVAEGSGTWSLDGREFPATQGDVLYVEPWVYHGVTNTGDEPLTFLVVRYHAKGVEIPPKPDGRPNEL